MHCQEKDLSVTLWIQLVVLQTHSAAIQLEHIYSFLSEDSPTFFILVLRPVKIISFILSRVNL